MAASSGGHGGGQTGGQAVGGHTAPSFDDFADAMDKLHAGMVKDQEKVETAAEKANRQLYQFQNALGALQTVLQGVSAVSNVANLLLGVFSNTVQQVAGQIGGLVKLVNPGVLDRFQKAFAAFQSQLGETFLPVLVGLTGLVQTVANALAGLTPQGRLFIVFLAGAAAGLTAGVTAGGIFVGMLGVVVGGLVAGALAAEVFSVALDAATAGFAAIGAVIGAVLSGVATLGSASAGGLGALSLASGGLESFTKALKPFLETLIGAFNNAGAALMPALAEALDALLPSLNELFEQMIQYVPLIGELLATFGAQILPPLVQILAEMLEAFLPFAEILTKMTVVGLLAASGILRLVAALAQIGNAINPILMIADLIRGKAPKGKTGFAEQPIQSAGYTGIEELFKRAQEQAILGKSGEQDDPFKKVMTDKGVIDQWAGAIGRSITQTLLNPNGGVEDDKQGAGGLANRIGGGISASPFAVAGAAVQAIPTSPSEMAIAVARAVASSLGGFFAGPSYQAAMINASTAAAARGE